MLQALILLEQEILSTMLDIDNDVYVTSRINKDFPALDSSETKIFLKTYTRLHIVFFS